MNILVALLVLVSSLSAGCTLPEWNFESEKDLKAWIPNEQVDQLQVADGTLSFRTTSWDPFLMCEGQSITASPWQYIHIRLKADHPGMGDLFWTGTTDGPYGGLSEEKKSRFRVQGGNEWEDIVVAPFWQTEGTIHKLRLDLYEGSHFEIDFIKICDWSSGATPSSETTWTFSHGKAPWTVLPGEQLLFSPPLELDAAQLTWAVIRLRSSRTGILGLLWGCGGERGLQSQDIEVKGDGRMRTYNLLLAGIPSWRKPVNALGLRLPEGKDNSIEIESVTLSSEPAGPPDLEVRSFGFENGVNRQNREASLMARISNLGGGSAHGCRLELQIPPGITLKKGSQVTELQSLRYGDIAVATWTVVSEQAGDRDVSLKITGLEEPVLAQTTLRFYPERTVTPLPYPPPPQPVSGEVDVCMYYFPGWDSPAKWDCIRTVAPIRKPLLGYYDEGKPECVDWQIKWAVENGIQCFLVDWYWCRGQQILNHWFDAYREARYRDFLKVAIMWANHNPPGSHDREDWRKVTREWIEKYFPLKSYCQVDGKPAVFIWAPDLIRNDFGGSAEVTAALQESQQMARDAGYKGITFIAMGNHESENQVQTLLDEGYAGATNYHEWGTAAEAAMNMKRYRFEDVVASEPGTWARRDRMCGSLTYYPVVDTGWDSRPWHGDKSLVIEGRTPELFEKLLTAARDYAISAKKPFIVLGPANEWGEGSYIEPATEYGFEMYEKIRAVFGKGDPSGWPENLSPADLGLGPYDFPPQPLVSSWDFDREPGDWRTMMNTGPLKTADGALHFRTSSKDPALMAGLNGIKAEDYSKFSLRMKITGQIKDYSHCQVFWSTEGSSISEATSLSLPLQRDGEMHEYVFDLSSNPRWRGRIAALRLDPCDEADVEVVIDSIALRK